MPEEFEEQAAQPFDIGRYLDIVRRRHVIFLAILLGGWALVWASSWILPARYKSSTVILVEQSSMPKNYVLPNINDNLEERLQSITQQILSRTRLLMIIDRHGLYDDPRHPMTPDDKVEKMRKEVAVDVERDPGSDQITGFKVSYSASSPRIAQQVAGELSSLFIDENLKVRQHESENTTAFIRNQLDSARANLADQDAKVRTFQSAHQGSLPTQQTSNLQILNGLQQQIQNEQDALNSARQQRIYTQSLINQYRAVPGTTATASAVPGTPSSLAAIDEQLNKLRAHLADLSTRYTDKYPEVQQTRAELARMEKAREQMLASLKAASAGKDNKSAEAQQPMDLVQSGPVLQLQGQLHASDLEIANREHAIASLNARIAEYQQRLNEEPAVEQQLADLTRGYEQSQLNYNDLLKKESDSEMATSMEQLQQGERFTVLDAPSLPLKPDFPNRLKFCGAGAGAGLALGILAVFILEFFDDRLHSDKEITKLLAFPVISEVPEILQPADIRRNKARTVFGWVMASAVFVVILAGTAFSFLHA